MFHFCWDAVLSWLEAHWVGILETYTQSTLDGSSWVLLHRILKSILEKHLVKVFYLGNSNMEHSGELDKKSLANEMWFRVQKEKENTFCKQMMCLQLSVCPQRVGCSSSIYIHPWSFQTLEPRGPALRTTLQRVSPRMLQTKGLVPVETHKPNFFQSTCL